MKHRSGSRPLYARVLNRLILAPVYRRFGKELLRHHYRERFWVWRARQGVVEFDDYRNTDPEYQGRYKLHRWILDVRDLGERPCTYLEFGVAGGDSIRWWLENARHSRAKFFGFDVFTGLPEQWESRWQGAFSTGGRAPVVEDSRCRFVKGMFQDTLISFLAETPIRTLPRPLVVHMDADLYSSTVYVLFTLGPHLRANDLLIFDEFSSYEHEFRALEDFTAATGTRHQLIGAVNNYRQVALLME